MFKGLHILILSLVMLNSSPGFLLLAQKSTPKKKSSINKKNRKRPIKRRVKKIRTVKKLEELYSRKKIKRATVLKRVESVKGSADSKKLLQARVYQDLKMIFLSSVYASQVVQYAKSSKENVDFAWKILHQNALKSPIQIILESLVDPSKRSSNPPYFKKDWSYYKGIYFLNKNKTSEAIRMLEQVEVGDRLYMPARFHLGILYMETDTSRALRSFQDILKYSKQLPAKLEGFEVKELVNYSRLAVARLEYERKNFVRSVRAYRSVDKDSHRYYDAIFEQAWPFFMAGYPNHALGALYGSESIFFQNKFNPETSILASIIYYWMCRYTDARNALAEFYEKYSSQIKGLNSFLKQKNLSKSTGYQMFENHLLNISEKSLGVSKPVLATAASSEPMMYYRDLLASLAEEKNAFGKRLSILSPKHQKISKEYLDKLTQVAKDRLGSIYLKELKALSKQYSVFEDQAQFIYLEMVMSEKESALGRELHDEKIRSVVDSDKVRGWGKGSESWKGSTKGEYWWDEVGYYIFNVKPECVEE